jgi:prepilin-type processing-associated H-X9-DG protein
MPGNHHDVEAPIAANNTGVLFLNSAIRYEQVSDGTSQTIFISEKLNDGLDLGWASGTRATLRNTGNTLNSQPKVPLTKQAGAADDVSVEGTEAAAAGDLARFVGGYSSRHPGGVNCAFGDGSVRFLKSSITASVLRLLGNRADGEYIDSDKF